MRTFWRWVTKPWRAAESKPAPAFAEAALVLPPLQVPEWTPTHAAEWRGFLAGPAGQALWLRLHGMEYFALLNAANKLEAGQMERAAGYGDLRRHLESLTISGQVPPATGTTAEAGNQNGDSDGGGDAGRTERERALRELMAP